MISERTVFALIDVLLNPGCLRWIELAIDIRMNQFSCPLTTQLRTSAVLDL